MDVEPYGSSDLGGDPSDDEPPSMTSTSPSEDDDPEDPEDPKGKKKKKKKKKTRRKMSLNYPLDLLMKSCRFCS